MPTPGDAEQAVRAQFAEAEQRNDVTAYRLFAARNPDHPLAREAERRVARLLKEGRPH
jgi:hypothetical protein